MRERIRIERRGPQCQLPWCSRKIKTLDVQIWNLLMALASEGCNLKKEPKSEEKVKKYKNSKGNLEKRNMRRWGEMRSKIGLALERKRGTFL